jgi:TolB-like protein
MAPRDVAPGALYADAIVRAINECKVLLIVLSQSAVASSHVGREIERGEYFGDGMAEEILDLLAKIPGLTVRGNHRWI